MNLENKLTKNSIDKIYSKMQILSYLIPIIALSLLCAGWVAVQFLAKKMGTKNHFDHGAGSCGKCNCSGASCSLEKNQSK